MPEDSALRCTLFTEFSFLYHRGVQEHKASAWYDCGQARNYWSLQARDDLGLSSQLHMLSETVNRISVDCI